MRILLGLAALPLVAACSGGVDDPRGVEKSETLLSVSASGEADTRPDEAFFTAGIENWARSAEEASSETQEDIETIVAALLAMGIEEKDIQTRTVGVQRIDWGDRKGQFQATNTVNVRVRDIDQAGAAVTVATSEGANIMSGPQLRLSDPEAAANSAYAAAYANARLRAEAYAEAAGMEISRVLYIRDAGGSQGGRYFQGAMQISDAVAPPPPVSPPPPMSRYPYPEMMEQSAGNIMPGQTTSAVTVQVDFALREI